MKPSMSSPVIIFHLELAAPEQFLPGNPGPPGLAIQPVAAPNPELNQTFYREVGRAWSWTDRLSWSREAWQEWLERPGVETWLALFEGIPAGYAELEFQPGPQLEIVYFGLLAAFCGRRLGTPFFSRLVARGWENGAKRIWLHTCSLDDPRALPFYQARGFRLFKTETVPTVSGPPAGDSPEGSP